MSIVTELVVGGPPPGLERFNPQKVILFGSYATGKNTEDSDIDFMVIMPFNGRRVKIEVEILKAMDDIRGAKDVVVLTQEEYDSKKKITGTIAYPAEHEGRVLYAA